MVMFKNIFISGVIGIIFCMGAGLAIFGATLGLCAIMLLGSRG
jgi:hypothetical protein